MIRSIKSCKRVKTETLDFAQDFLDGSGRLWKGLSVKEEADDGENGGMRGELLICSFEVGGG